MTTWPSATTGKLEERYTPSPGCAVLVFTPLCSARRTLVPAGTSIVFAGGVAAGVAGPAVAVEATVWGGAAVAGGASVATGAGDGAGAGDDSVCAPATEQSNDAHATNPNIFFIDCPTPLFSRKGAPVALN